ncbi:RimK/LysX family protein [uncultured Jannaschia sp.]|uniref:ATP-dependent zinc protease family protein n=1 Tax=uncultured Jannaschia sp. TaxID=293347 RepID=UPI00262142FA|nr:RimK/LysX family protein [uncultured Jannaschia sp.]
MNTFHLPERKIHMLTIGWEERVSLPLLGLTGLKAKIDTGARTSALHATDIVPFDRDGIPWVRFHSRFDDDTRDIDVECPIHDQRNIKNTSGVPEMRYIIRTRFAIARRAWRIDLSLTERTDMTFRMIVGRTALRNRSVLVDPGGRNLTELPKTDLAERGHHERTSP